MSRYIDADALIEDLDKGTWGRDWDKALAEAIINDAPSIDMVRCKECKHYYNRDPQKVPTASIQCFNMHSDDFCSYGEPKGDE